MSDAATEGVMPVWFVKKLRVLRWMCAPRDVRKVGVCVWGVCRVSVCVQTDARVCVSVQVEVSECVWTSTN